MTNPLPWPAEFGRPRPWFFVTAIVVCAGAGVFFAMTAVLAVAHGDALRCALGAGGAVFAIAGALVFTRRVRTRKPLTAGIIGVERDAQGRAAVVVPMDRTVTMTLAIALLGGGVFLIALALVRVTDADHQLRPLRIGSAIFFLAVAAVSLALAPVLVASARTPRRIVLSEYGVHQNNGAVDQSLPWQRIAGIEAAEADPSARNSSRRIPMILLRPASPSDIAVLWRFRWFRQRTFLDVISVQPVLYRVDGGLLYYTLRFYWQHPELRAELGSDAAVERMRRGDVLG